MEIEWFYDSQHVIKTFEFYFANDININIEFFVSNDIKHYQIIYNITKLNYSSLFK